MSASPVHDGGPVHGALEQESHVDEEMIGRIDELVAEEHRLHERSSHGEALSDEDRRRLSDVEVHLDQCWDLLRQRRARRDAGQDPEDIAERPARIVENYQQ